MTDGNKTAWRAFPTAAKPKLWVGEGDSLRSALGLYHPFSFSGRAATTAASFLPSSLAFALFCGRPDKRTAARLGHIASLIHDTLGDTRLNVSFSPGTPGSHQKLTAQASSGGKAVAYVKIAETKTIETLLANEAEMLHWGHDRHLKSVVLPQLIGLKRHGEMTLLFLGAPPRPGRQSPLHADQWDRGFLNELASLDSREISLEQCLDAMGILALRNRSKKEERTEASLVAEAVEAISAHLGERGVRLGVMHGDYSPWNTLRLDDGSLYVFDWEYGSQKAPLLADALYRLSAPARLVLGWTPEKILARLITLPDHPIFGPLAGEARVSRANYPAYLLLFLLQGWIRERKQEKRNGHLYEAMLRRCLDLFREPRRRLTVLVAAYACEPDKGSEPGVGWNMAQQISRDHDAWVLTKDNNRAPIEKALAKRPNPNLHFVFVGLPRWLSFWKKGQRGVRAYYYLWQFAAWRAARRLGRNVHFDLAHHVTFVNDTAFSFLALLPHPFIWGPIGSHPLCPRAVLPNRQSALEDRLRYAFRAVLRSIDPLFWLCASRATLIIGISGDTRRHFPLSLAKATKFLVSPAIAVDRPPARFADLRKGAIQSIFVGRFVFLKGPHLALRAFASFAEKNPEAELSLIGDGPMRAELGRLAKLLGVSHRVHFCGWRPRDEVLRQMAHNDVFLFPSVEGGGMVVLEAMAQGLPIVCLDYGGPGAMVTDDCGIRVKISSVEVVVADLASALTLLAQDKALCHRMGAAGFNHVKLHHEWLGRTEAITSWYRAIQAVRDSTWWTLSVVS